MNLVVQIPCYNEQDSITEVLSSIPKKIKGIDNIEIVVLDDGSEDKTSEIAKDFGAKVIKLNFFISFLLVLSYLSIYPLRFILYCIEKMQEVMKYCILKC